MEKNKGNVWEKSAASLSGDGWTKIYDLKEGRYKLQATKEEGGQARLSFGVSDRLDGCFHIFLRTDEIEKAKMLADNVMYYCKSIKDYKIDEQFIRDMVDISQKEMFYKGKDFGKQTVLKGIMDRKEYVKEDGRGDYNYLDRIEPVKAKPLSLYCYSVSENSGQQTPLGMLERLRVCENLDGVLNASENTLFNKVGIYKMDTIDKGPVEYYLEMLEFDSPSVKKEIRMNPSAQNISGVQKHIKKSELWEFKRNFSAREISFFMKQFRMWQKKNERGLETGKKKRSR